MHNFNNNSLALTTKYSIQIHSILKLNNILKNRNTGFIINYTFNITPLFVDKTNSSLN